MKLKLNFKLIFIKYFALSFLKIWLQVWSSIIVVVINVSDNKMITINMNICNEITKNDGIGKNILLP